MKTLIVGFSRPKKWKPYAAAIMWLDGTDFDHLYMRFETEIKGFDMMYQASGNRTNFMGSVYFEKHNVVVEEYAVDVPDELYQKMLELAWNREGIPYAICQVIGKGIAALCNKIFKTKMKNPFPGSDSQSDCIEEGSIILRLDEHARLNLDMNTVTPLPVRNFMAQSRAFRRVK